MKTKVLSSEWIPARTPSSKVLIVLHGRGDSPAGFRWLPRALQWADVNYLLLRAPDEYYGGYSWYDLPPNQGPGILRSRQWLDILFDELSEQGLRTEDTILFGFSQGCLMTLEWGGRTARPFAGFVGISGYCFDPLQLAKDLSTEAKQGSWLITHGTLDGVLDFDRTHSQVQSLQAAGLPLEFYSFPKEHTIDDSAELPLLQTWLADRWAARAKKESR